MSDVKSLISKIFILALILFFIGVISSCTKEKTETTVPDSTNVANKDSIQIKKFDHFLFVGYYYGKPSVYNYQFEDQKFKVRWNDYKESVIILLFDPEKPTSFFLTARGYGKAENHAYVNRIKLYRYDNKSDEITFVEEIGSGIQVTAEWNDVGNLEIQYTAVDKTVASFINKFRKIYNSYGMLVDDEMRAFDLAKEGYPELIPRRSSTISPSGKYGITINEDSLFVKKADSDDKDFVDSVSHNINNIIWNYDESFIFISTLDLSSKVKRDKAPQTSELFAYDIENKKAVAKWTGSGYKNFEVLNDYLIFDNGFGNKSSICIYNYIQQDTLDVIKVYNGCGLSFIPTLN